MHRIDGAAAAPGGFFTDGDPGVGTPATVVTDDWLNAVQEEVVAVIGAAGIALSKPSNTQLLASLRVLIGSAVPPGAVQAFAVAVAPAGYLECNGGTFAAAAYPALAAALGTTWGAAPAGEIRLPDLRGEFPRGWDNGRGVDAGRAFATSQGDLLKAHTHTGKVGGAYGGDHVGSAGFEDARGAPDWQAVDLGSTGGAETRPRNVALLFCIKV